VVTVLVRMISELNRLQDSDERVTGVTMSFNIETECEENDELVHREYTFSWAKEWDKWMFQEFREQRTPNDCSVSERNWRDSQHIMWTDVGEEPSITVPPEVTDRLKEATGAESVVIQVPVGGIQENKYERREI